MAEKKQSGPKDAERQARERIEQVRVLSAGRLAGEVVYAPEHGVVFIVSRGQFDIHETVVALPVPYLFTVVASILANVVAPTFASFKVKPLSESMGSPEVN